MQWWGGLFSVMSDSWEGCACRQNVQCSPSLQFFFLSFSKLPLAYKKWEHNLWRVLEVRYPLLDIYIYIKKKKTGKGSLRDANCSDCRHFFQTEWRWSSSWFYRYVDCEYHIFDPLLFCHLNTNEKSAWMEAGAAGGKVLEGKLSIHLYWKGFIYFATWPWKRN